MYLPRMIDTSLESWANASSRCPLVLRGGRQVGKTEAMMALAARFGNHALADFELAPELRNIFAGNLNPTAIIRDLEASLGVRIEAGRTLLILDEIQECPRAIQSLRYFKEKLPALHVIAAGSLLEFALGEISFPVGRVDYMHLYPMSFDEFLTATDRAILVERRPRRTAWDNASELSQTTAQALNDALREYLVVGGMPEAVATYKRTRSFLEVQRIHDRLIRSFRDDIPKYASGELQRRNVSQVFAAIAAAVGEQVTFTKLVDDDSKRTKASLFLLEKAMLLSMVHSTSPAGLPLGASSDLKTFKPVFIDVGLMQRLCGRQARDIMATDDLVASFKGQVAEQFVGQELLASGLGSEAGRLYFWVRQAKGSGAEVDYLIVRDGQVTPVEVKSGSSGRLRSLHLLLKSYDNIKSSFCLQSRDNCSTSDQITFVPLYFDLS